MVARFLLYNLLPSIIAGTIVWLVIIAAVNVLSIRQAQLRLSLLVIPVIKSTLVMLGVSPVFFWSGQLLSVWEEQAVPTNQVLPFLLVWAIGVLVIQTWIVVRERKLILQSARPATSSPRLVQTLETVLKAFRRQSSLTCMNGLHCGSTQVPEPKLQISDRLASPVALTSGGAPTIIFPSDLISHLDDDELAAAMAHELAHFGLRHPWWCSANTLRKLSIVSPIAWLVATSIDKEEEKACDEIAVKILGKAESYAEMLVKSYRFSRIHMTKVSQRLRLVPQLLGLRPMLSNRVERLLSPRSPLTNQTQQSIAACLLWTGLYLLFLA